MVTQTVEPAILTKFTPEIAAGTLLCSIIVVIWEMAKDTFSIFRVLSMERELKQHVDHLPADFNRINGVRAIPEL